MDRRHFLLSAVALGGGLHALGAGAAGSYPNRPIKIVVAYAAGTVLDLWARRVAERLSRAVNQQVVVENRPGASGTLGANFAANAAPDGYTLFYGGATDLALAISLFPNLVYDKDKPFEPITRFTSGNSVLVVNPKLPVRSIQDLVTYAKARPGQLKGGSPGNATLTHMLLMGFNLAAGVDIIHVPYKSGMQAMSDVMAGHIDLMFDWMTAARPFITAGKLRPLLIAGAERKPILPEVPAATELGWKQIDFWGWNAFVAPARTPRPIIDYLHKTLNPILHSADWEAELRENGGAVTTSTPDETAAFIGEERKRYQALVRQTGVKVE